MTWWIFGRKTRLLKNLEKLLMEQRGLLQKINQTLGPRLIQDSATQDNEGEHFSLKSLEGGLEGLAIAIRKELDWW